MSKSGRVAFTVRIPETLHRDLRMACADTGADLQDAVSEALERYLKGSGGSWPLEGVTIAETQRAAHYVEALRACSPEVRALLVKLVALAPKH